MSEPQHHVAGLDTELAAGQDVLDLLLDREGMPGLTADIAFARLVLLQQDEIALLEAAVVSPDIKLLVAGNDGEVVGRPALQLVLRCHFPFPFMCEAANRKADTQPTARATTHRPSLSGSLCTELLRRDR